MLDLHLSSEPGILTQVRDQMRDWAATEGWSEHQIGEITLAVDEALSNVIRHGYNSEPGGEIHMISEMVDDAPDGRGLRIQIRDNCQGVDLDKICGRNLEDVRPGGLGVHLIHAMMQKVEYAHSPSGGVQLTMIKSLSHVAKDQDQDQDQNNG